MLSPPEAGPSVVAVALSPLYLSDFTDEMGVLYNPDACDHQDEPGQDTVGIHHRSLIDAIRLRVGSDKCISYKWTCSYRNTDLVTLLAINSWTTYGPG